MNRISLIFLLLLITTGISAQNQSLRGCIVSENTKKPIDLVNVLILKKGNLVRGTVSDDQGNFSLSIPIGEYTLRLEQFNQILLEYQIFLKNDVDMGFIFVQDVVELGEITLESKKKIISKKGDKVIFDVEHSISAKGGNIYDVLKVTPGIRVVNEQISVVGRDGLLVMIDGRTLQLSGEDLMNFLKNINSDDIKNIEVINLPSARYDAEGNNGIINIILKKNDDGLSGNIKSTYIQAIHSLGSLGGIINYKRNNWIMGCNFNYTNGIVSPYQEYTLYYPSYTWFEKNNKRHFYNTLSGKLNIEYNVNKNIVMGIQYHGINSEPLIKNENISEIIMEKGTLNSFITTSNRLKIRDNSQSINFYSSFELDSLGSKCSVDVDYFKYTSDWNSSFNTQSYDSTGNIIQDNSIKAHSLNGQNIDIYSAKVDYELPLNWVSLSFGGKLSFIKSNSYLFYFDTTSGDAILDITKGNIFKHRENTQALYLLANKNIAKKLDLLLGFRLENTQIKSHSRTLNETHQNTYMKVFPTIHLNFQVDNLDISLGYNKRINRPSYRDLNPFKLYTSKFNYSEGNPFLRPSYVDNVEISLIYGSYFGSLYFDYLSDGFDQVTIVSQKDPIQKVISKNFYTRSKLGTTHGYTFKFRSWFESGNLFSIYYSNSISNLENIPISTLSNWTTYFSSNNNIVLNKKKTLKVDLTFNYQSPSIAGSYEITSWYHFDIGIKYSMLKGSIQAVLSVLDIFRTKEMIFTQTVNGVNQKNFDYRDTQKVKFDLTWNFGKSFKREDREQSNEDERKRLH